MDVVTLSGAELVERARSLAESGGRRLLGITGAPGTGKSTLARTIVDALGPKRCVLVPMDGFHLANATLIAWGRRDRKGAWDTFDADGYVHLLRRLRDQAARRHQFAHRYREFPRRRPAYAMLDAGCARSRAIRGAWRSTAAAITRARTDRGPPDVRCGAGASGSGARRGRRVAVAARRPAVTVIACEIAAEPVSSGVRRWLGGALVGKGGSLHSLIGQAPWIC